MITTIVILLAALYLIWMAVIMETKNFLSAFLFQYVPVLLGIALLIIIVIENIELVKAYL